MTPDEQMLLSILTQQQSQQQSPSPAASQAMGGMFAVAPQHLQRMAGDVVPFPITAQQSDMNRLRGMREKEFAARLVAPHDIHSIWQSAPIIPLPGTPR